MAKRTRKPPSGELVAIREIDGLVKKVRQFIWGIGFFLALIFTWLQFKDIPFVDFIESTKPEILLKVTLAVYYSCWIFGSGFDLSIQQAAYIHDPYHGRLPKEAYLFLVAFGLIAGLLFWASSNHAYFAIMLTVFVPSNILGWVYIVRRVQPIIQASRNKYLKSGDLLGVERLQIVTNYMCGNWQRHRFIAMCILVLLADLILFIPMLRNLIIASFGWMAVGTSSDAINRILPEILFLLFVLVAELWIWFKRMQTKTAVETIDTLNTKYVLRVR